MTLEFHETVARHLRDGRAVAIATLIDAQGSTPRGFGSRMIVLESGETGFSIGGGAFEALVIADALQAIRDGRGTEKEYRFTEEGENATGMVCGGSARVLIEVVQPPAPLYVFGAGHVGRELAAIGRRLGFAVTLVDDRPACVAPDRLPEGSRGILAGAGYESGLPEIRPGAFAAIVTRCHRTDLEVLRHVVGREAAYVGLIGSRRKIATVLDRARALGTPPAALDEVRAPIGLPIGAQTPEEIAVSIAAELIQVRAAGIPRGRAAAAALDADGAVAGGRPPQRGRKPVLVTR
jgi:xanthine dehydrogenase accessory factor